MAEQGQHKGNIIIKRVKKIEAGAHGGSWKVAYADLVTAMMAFFLLMWLLNMVPQEKKEQLASYFNEFSLFKNPPPSSQPLDSGGVGPPAALVGSKAERPDVTVDRDGESPSGGSGDKEAEAKAAALEKQLEQQLEKLVPDLAGQVSVTQDKDKVRIEIMDKTEHPLFELGGLTLLPDAQRALAAVTDVLKKEGVKVAVEGHTDAYRYSGTYTNWDLSAGRALSARRLMVQYGFPQGNVSEVAGYADTKLYVPEKPYDPKNRRISLLAFRPPQPGDKAGNGKSGASGGGTGDGKDGKDAPGFVPSKTPEVGDVLEKQIDNLYDKSTQGQF